MPALLPSQGNPLLLSLQILIVGQPCRIDATCKFVPTRLDLTLKWAVAGRLKRKERKGTLTEELLADPVLAETRAKRFGALQEERQRWSHKQVKRKTNNERKKVHKRPRH